MCGLINISQTHASIPCGTNGARQHVLLHLSMKRVSQECNKKRWAETIPLGMPLRSYNSRVIGEILRTAYLACQLLQCQIGDSAIVLRRQLLGGCQVLLSLRSIVLPFKITIIESLTL
jgi:hypothetical protein